MTEIKKTSLFDRHIAAGAKMVPFCGYNMPINYADGIKAEQKAVRESVGIFDVSHMGEFIIQGPEALAFLQKMTVNDVAKLEVNDAQYSAMCYPDGGIVDDLILYRRDDGYFMVVNASNIDKDFRWLKDHATDGLTLQNKSEDYSLIAVQGPKTRSVLSKLTDADLTMKFYSCADAVIAGHPVMLSRTGYTGELGFEIYGSHEAAQDIWDALTETGQVKPAGLASRDILRMEMKYALYGNDIDKSTNPIEAGLGWITALDKEDFIAKDILVNVKKEKPARRLITFEMTDRGIPRHGYEIQVNGEQVGFVTSGTQSPSLDKGIGIGFVKLGLHKSGQEIDIIIRNKPVGALIVKPPFVKNTSLMD